MGEKVKKIRKNRKKSENFPGYGVSMGKNRHFFEKNRKKSEKTAKMAKIGSPGPDPKKRSKMAKNDLWPLKMAQKKLSKNGREF